MPKASASNGKSHDPIRVRVAKSADAAAMAAVARAAYAAWPASNIANERNFALQTAAFPGGQFVAVAGKTIIGRSEEHTSELQSLMRTSYAVFCLKKKKKQLCKRT